MKAMIFAAGLGTRLKPLTDRLPKALVEVGGEPLLKRQIDELKNAGFNDLVINVHHFGGMIREYLRDHSNFGTEIHISDETDLLRDTGGGIKHAATLLNDNEPFLIHNVDIFSNVNLNDFYEFHLNSAISDDTPLATLLVSDRVTLRYLLFDVDNNLVGWINLQSGEVKSPFKELASAKIEEGKIEEFLTENGLRKFAFAGMHVISPYVFRLMQKWPEKFSIIDFYLSVCDKYNIRAFVKDDLKLIDVGKIETLDEAEDFIKSKN